MGVEHGGGWEGYERFGFVHDKTKMEGKEDVWVGGSG